MLSYVARRLLLLLPTWIFVAIIAFFVIHMTPGNPADVLAGQENLGSTEIIRQRLGLDKPLITQLWVFLRGLPQGDLGESFFLGQSVVKALSTHIPVTFGLAGVAILIAMALGVPLGVAAALRPNTIGDTVIMFVSLIGLSIPEFVTGLVLIFFFAVHLGWMPAGGYTAPTEDLFRWFRQIIMPAFALGFMQSAYVARMTRSSMLEVLTSDYIRTANAKGLRRRIVIWKHALRNGLIPVVTAIGLVFAMLLSGAFITEALFRLPGVGTLVIDAVKRRDYPVVQGSLLIIATIVLIVNLLVDVLYAAIDPRIQYD